ncbi:MAG: Hsp70 family protein [Planctomycetaceae bacterium]|nr:Hsp70 family protein [Planctomycetaceae bacterium]
MKHIQAIGIDLGTTYSCIAWLNEHGHPVTIPNQEGELSTPSVVYFDHDEPIVGTEALRNAIAHPDRVIQNAKRHIGDAEKYWEVGGARYTPVHISGLILRKLIAATQERVGEITEAVVTVPAQFSEAQRRATVLAGLSAGLERVEIINEPVAAALCHVLGNEGLAFTELAIDQQLLVYDLGGGTLDLAVVKYTSDQVRVVASDGDLELGGLDWTQVLVDIAADYFIHDFGEDPRKDPESHQFLALEAEQAKRSLSVRPRTAITVQHGGHRRTYQVELAEFVHGCRKLLTRSETVTRRILADNKFGWAHIDAVLTTGGASRMPMIRDSLKKLSGRTLNTSLSPDQSIAHGAAYYAGMLLSNQEYARTVFSSEASTRLSRLRQQSVNARSLGILIREESGERVPHYLIPSNTPLPASKTHVFGTVVDNQTKVRVRIVESGAGPDKPHTVLGDCVISELPPNLPEGSMVEVTISYDRQARVHVAARELNGGASTEVELIRHENLSSQLQEELIDKAQLQHAKSPPRTQASAPARVPQPSSQKKPPNGREAAAESGVGVRAETETREKPERSLSEEWELISERLVGLAGDNNADSFDQPVILCNKCGAEMFGRTVCPACGFGATPDRNSPGRKKKQPAAPETGRRPGRKRKTRRRPDA